MGESTKNIDAIFEEARFSDAILVFDEAEGLFGSRTSMTYGEITSLHYLCIAALAYLHKRFCYWRSHLGECYNVIIILTKNFNDQVTHQNPVTFIADHSEIVRCKYDNYSVLSVIS